MKQMDGDKDGLVSLPEFIAETKNPDFDQDEEWKTIDDDEQFTEEEMQLYEKGLEREEEEEFMKKLHGG